MVAFVGCARFRHTFRQGGQYVEFLDNLSGIFDIPAGLSELLVDQLWHLQPDSLDQLRGTLGVIVPHQLVDLLAMIVVLDELDDRCRGQLDTVMLATKAEHAQVGEGLSLRELIVIMQGVLSALLHLESEIEDLTSGPRQARAFSAKLDEYRAMLPFKVQSDTQSASRPIARIDTQRGLAGTIR